MTAGSRVIFYQKKKIKIQEESFGLNENVVATVVGRARLGVL